MILKLRFLRRPEEIRQVTDNAQDTSSWSIEGLSLNDV